MIPLLSKILIEREDAVRKWLDGHRQKVECPIYTSVDIRNAHFKLSVIDTNIYPAGFNNLVPTYEEALSEAFEKYISEKFGAIARILVISEANTRNKFYMENLNTILDLLAGAGYEARAGLISEKLHKDRFTAQAISGPMELGKVKREGDTIGLRDFTPDLIISNNDFTDGIPTILANAPIPVAPSPELGWHMRRKSDHFSLLSKLNAEFAEIIGIDPWLITPLSVKAEDVDFRTGEGVEVVAERVDELIENIRDKYREHEISERPFVFVKSDSGTYGMAVTIVSSGEDLAKLNSKERKKMGAGKGAQSVSRVIIQEGVPTHDKHKDCPVEPVIYLIGGEMVGGFFRINCERSIRENLNTRGMTFSKLEFAQLSSQHPTFLDDDYCKDEVMTRIFGTIAAIAAIATGYELKNATADGNSPA